MTDLESDLGRASSLFCCDFSLSMTALRRHENHHLTGCCIYCCIWLLLSLLLTPCPSVRATCHPHPSVLPGTYGTAPRWAPPPPSLADTAANYDRLMMMMMMMMMMLMLIKCDRPAPAARNRHWQGCTVVRSPYIGDATLCREGGVGG